MNKYNNKRCAFICVLAALAFTSCKDSRIGTLLLPSDTVSEDYSTRSYVRENGMQQLVTEATFYTLNGRLEFQAEDGTVRFPLRLTSPIKNDYTGKVMVNTEAKPFETKLAPRVMSKVGILAPELYELVTSTVTVPAGKVESVDKFSVKLLDIKSLDEGYYCIPLRLMSEDKGAKVSSNTSDFNVILHISHDHVHGLWSVEKTDAGLEQIPVGQLSLNSSAEYTQGMPDGDYTAITDGDPMTGISVYVGYPFRIDGIGGSLKAIGLRAQQEEFWGSMSLKTFPSELKIKYLDKNGVEHALGNVEIMDPPALYSNPDQFRLIKLIEPINDAESVIIHIERVDGWGYAVGFSEIKLYR